MIQYYSSSICECFMFNEGEANLCSLSKIYINFWPCLIFSNFLDSYNYSYITFYLYFNFGFSFYQQYYHWFQTILFFFMFNEGRLKFENFIIYQKLTLIWAFLIFSYSLDSWKYVLF